MGAEPQAVAVALSGGVDSSLAAALLLERGQRVVGLTMRLSDEAEATLEAARAVAAHLGVEHHVVDCREAFEAQVLRSSWDEYSRGRTPNPCVRCNEGLKFGVLLERARQLGASRLATGHHARLRLEPTTGRPVLSRGADARKDQSYFLARLSAEQLQAALFPIGELTKAEVRARARLLGLPSAERPESQDTCLALDEATGREGAFAETLRRRFAAEPRPGELVDAETGAALGRHQGVHLFTIGQRRGLGVALGRRAYVTAIDAASGRVELAARPEALLCRALLAHGATWHRPEPPERCLAQIRFRHSPVEALVHRLDDEAFFVEFVDPVAAVTPGQAVVLYDAEEVIGSGWIERAEAP